MAHLNKPAKLKETMFGASELALHLAQDKTFRKKLLSAIEHSAEARRRAGRNLGLAGAARRIATDQVLRTELRNARKDLQQVYAKLEGARRGRRIRTITLLAGIGLLAALPQVRQRVTTLIGLRSQSLDDMTKEELYARAQAAEIPGRSEMNKDELLAALRDRATTSR